jgi:hypothetical protein
VLAILESDQRRAGSGHQQKPARDATSGSPGSLTGTACGPATTHVITIAIVVPQGLRPTNVGSRFASPNADPEG